MHAMLSLLEMIIKVSYAPREDIETMHACFRRIKVTFQRPSHHLSLPIAP